MNGLGSLSLEFEVQCSALDFVGCGVDEGKRYVFWWTFDTGFGEMGFLRFDEQSCPRRFRAARDVGDLFTHFWY